MKRNNAPTSASANNSVAITVNGTMNANNTTTSTAAAASTGTIVSSSTTTATPVTLNRRRGTTINRGGGSIGIGKGNNKGLKNAWKSPLIILVVIAITLTIGMILLFVAYMSPNSTTGRRIKNSHIVQRLPGIPNLLRGRHEPIKVLSSKSNNIQQQQQQEQPVLSELVDTKDTNKETDTKDSNQSAGTNGIGTTERREEAGGSSSSGSKTYKESQPAIDLKKYDTVPTEYYPYSLEAVPDGYTVETDYIVKGGQRYSEYTTGGTPYIVTTNTIQQESNTQARSRRKYVKSTMEFVWSNYVKYAFGYDELQPSSGSGSNGWGGQGITLVDSLDTLWLMNMTTEFYHARDWVRDHLDHSKCNEPVSVFETTIRDLGGLLSAYDWSNDIVFLQKAIDLGERLLGAFTNANTGIPYGQVVPANGHTSNIGWTGNSAILAEFGTIQIEFNYLAKASGRPELAEKTTKVFEIMNSISPDNGLFPYFYSNSGSGLPKPINDKITFGAMADSFYEYMLKLWLQSDKTNTMYLDMYNKAMDGMHAELLQVSTPSGLTFIADRNGGVLDTKMDHLVCFMGGLLALGAYTNPDGIQSDRAQRDLRTGKALTYTCYQMYARMNTGISAEYVQFYSNKDFDIGRGAPHYLLRPEVVESLFILNYLTGDPIYREWGWEIYQSIERYCKTKYGYGGLDNVQNTNGHPRDKMESFFLAETLKYLYLLQDPDTKVDILNTHVFNTEAHPMRIFSKMDPSKTI